MRLIFLHTCVQLVVLLCEVVEPLGAEGSGHRDRVLVIIVHFYFRSESPFPDSMIELATTRHAAIISTQ